ncbi:MAG TPA: hypothetical protein VMT09_03250 [Steroidobacteraceae bacterium]|nr:hypothetical protein [Steroidobacteraceae bacterium]
MRGKWCRACRGFALLWPLIVHAKVLDIPELGVRIADAPAAATAPKVTDWLQGYTASFQVGGVYAAIERLSDPLPATATLADSRFRSGVRDYFDLNHGPEGRREERTSIAGREAWSRCGADARPDPSVYWHCAYYLVSDQHLYRLLVNAESPQKPPEFDAVVRALYGISFEPVAMPVGPDGQPVAPRKQPLFKMEHMDRDWYPHGARANGGQGVVDVDFSVDGKGRAQDLHVSYATSPDFTPQIADMVHNLLFKVPSGWETSDSRAERFTMEIQFALAPCSFPDPRVDGAIRVTVCTSRIR